LSANNANNAKDAKDAKFYVCAPEGAPHPMNVFVFIRVFCVVCGQYCFWWV